MIPIIKPHWPAPAHVHAFTTTRVGGVSLAPYDTLNLGAYVKDNPDHIAQNRKIVCEALSLPSEPAWLAQQHTTVVLKAAAFDTPPCADASFTREKGKVCVVTTADCLPVLVCDKTGTVVSAIHAGWRGLAGGIVPFTLEHLNIAAEETLVWLGPAIGPTAFEVRDDVRDLFLAEGAAESMHFKPYNDRFLCNMYDIARYQCAKLGVTHVYGGDLCTFSDPKQFYSFRREGETGRMGTMIFLS